MPDYGTVAAFRAYHTARGRDTTAYDDTEVEAAKLITSEWIDAKYRAGWPGLKLGQREQVRDWPRTGGFDVNGDSISSESVPTEVDDATYEGTLRELQTPGALSVDYTPSKYTRVSIDGAISVAYADRSAVDVQTQFQVIDQILSPILTGYGAVSGLSGKVGRA